MRTSVLLTICWLLAGGTNHATASELDERKVRESVKFAVDFLTSQQSQETGSWPEYTGFPGGVTALCTLALLKSGVDRNDDVVRKSLEHLQNLEAPDRTYTNSLQIMVYCEAGAMEFEELMTVRNVRWLENAQATAGGDVGGWTYTSEPCANQVDGSNTHFALVALHEASEAGILIKAATWRRAHQFWIKRQNADGSWPYSSLFDSPSGGMTCAGIVSLTITADQLRNSKTARKQSDAAIRRAFAWLEENYSVRKNPGSGPVHTFGYLYALSQAGQLTKQRMIGQYDWYQEGAEMLIETQDVLQGFWRGTHIVEENRLITTSYALLFLASQQRGKSANETDLFRDR